MCGIAGSLSLDGAPIAHTAARAMTDAWTHRGPDEGAVRMLGPAGALAPPLLGLGHRRLSVIDLSPAAAQPMSDPQGRGWISYNGELYNAAELRGLLEARGIRFRSRSDTEVVLQALLAWGEAALERFNGMFALAFWETSSRRLLLARDRYGEKPLYYAEAFGRLHFASELGALPFSGDLRLEIDPEAVELYLTFGFVPAPWTIYRAARKLPHASVLVASPGCSPRIPRYYRLEEHLARERTAVSPEEVRERLRRAVRRRLLADVPLGAFLSGGIDSSAVVGLMRPDAPSPLRTYSMAVPGLGYFDESARARATSRRFETEHHEVSVDAARLQAEIPAVLDRLDEPFADSSALAASLIARAARRHLTVALSGDGGDEVFGGYRLYRALAAHPLLVRLPPAVRRPFEKVLSSFPARHGGGAPGVVGRLRKLLSGLSSELAAAHAAWMSICDAATRREIRPAVHDAEIGSALVLERYRRFGGGLNRTLAVEVDLPLPDDMLAKVDRTSMHHALEVRAPFLDPEVVEMALSLPARCHFSPLSGKHLLRRALKGLLPRSILRGPKRGFEVPVGHWLTGPLGALYADIASAGTLRSLPGIDPAVARRWYAEHASRSVDRGRALWALFALCWWQRGPRARHARVAQCLEDSRREVTVFSRSEG